ncbi:MAG: class I SAM-dependent methyltransferase [Bacteroidales bacterium]|nr:class I SAM-dependent methyltransferase [Bacteroidales bacterium]MCF8405773.1 class I SAM-dependent methyltransferase [Bacteroidales bacterium]
MAKYLKTDFDFNSKDLVELMDDVPIWSAPFGLKLLDHIRYSQNLHVLDIGFGTGFPLIELAMRLGKTSKILGVDPWDAAVDRAEKKIEYYGISNVEIIRGVAEEIPLGDQSIDLITSNNGLNNVADLDKSLQECARVIKKGGQFIQTLNLNTTMMELYEVMEKVLFELKLDQSVKLMHEHIAEKRKPLDACIALIEKKGFSVENILHDRFEYKFTDATAMFNHYFIRLAFLDGWKSSIPEDRQTEVFNMIERNMNEMADREGVCKLSVPFVLIDCKKL